MKFLVLFILSLNIVISLVEIILFIKMIKKGEL